MKSIKQAEKTILSLISQKVPEQGTPMKKSMFVLDYTIDGRQYLFHTLSRECIEYSGNKIDDTIRIDRPDEQQKYLITHRFYVNENNDECQTYCSIISMLRMMKQKKGYSTYTILPTTHCNARCFYCYEQDYHFTSMDDEKSEQLIRFIEKTHSEKEIQLRWFGGEPLLGRKMISHVCSSLRQKGIPFHSVMVTNGALFNVETVNEAAELWNLKLVQITLDGDEEEYNRRKNYKDSSESPFRKVIHAIHLLQDAGINTQIRLNMDFENCDSMIRLADHLDHVFENKNHISVYAHPLFLTALSPRCAEIWEECLKTEDLFALRGFNTSSVWGIGPLKMYYCIASNPDCVAIGADGLVYGCEHCHEDSLLGTMDVISKERKTTVITPEIREKCRHCAFLPDCTEFADCPDLTYDCKAVHEIKLLHTLRKMAAKQAE